MDCSMLGFPVLLHLQELLKLMSTESVMPFNYLNLCFPFLLLLSIFPRIRVISNELTLPISWPKYWSFSFSIKSFNGYSELISFRIDWFDFLAFQGTLKILLQHHSLKASILQQSALNIYSEEEGKERGKHLTQIKWEKLALATCQATTVINWRLEVIFLNGISLLT